MKFLDINGLGHFLDKVKTWTGDNYYAKKTGVSVSDNNIKISGDTTSTSINYAQVIIQDSEVGQKTLVGTDGVLVTDINSDILSKIYADSITSPKFIKDGGTSSQVLLANGDVATLDAANGIPTLNADGKLDASKVDIDTTLFEVVTELPNTNATIIKNRIYLKTSAEQDANGKNIYAEYIYTGDLSTDYDESKWEKLGEYKSDVDLSGYLTKTEGVKGLGFSPTEDHIDFVLYYGDNHTYNITAPLANDAICGMMSAADKSKLKAIADSATADEALTNDDIDTLFTA